MMAILVTYVSNVLRASKDAMIVPVLGVEIISSLKLWAVLPASVIFILIYSKLANLFSKEKVFYIIVGFFLSFFLIFSFIIYPAREAWHLDLSSLIEQFPSMKWSILMISHWSFTLFYIMCEICGNVSVFILFWQLANEINTIKEAKKYYALFILAANIGQIISGLSVKAVSWKFASNWESSLQTLMSGVSLALVSVTIIYIWIQRNIIKQHDFTQESKEPKKKMTLRQSLKFILSSKYIGLVASIIICYSISINILEGIWKSQLRIQYPTNDEYNEFLGNYQVIAGSCYMFLVLIGAGLIRKYSWLFCAIVTPLIVLITGVIFFALTIFDQEMENIATYFGVTVVFAAVFIGTLQNILSKGMKYSIFDITKEISYIPLDEELKTKGKAAADLIGHKLGKSGGALIQWAMLSIIPGSNILDLVQYFFIVFALAMFVWFWSVTKLNKEFLDKVKMMPKEEDRY